MWESGYNSDMKRRFFLILRTSLLLSGCVLLFTSITIVGNAQEDAPERVFVATGFGLSGEYLEFYDSFEDAELLFGAPITDVFFSNEFQREVQFFEKARLERSDDGENVQISPIGELYYDHSLDANAIDATSWLGCSRYSRVEGYDDAVCFEFRKFLNNHGGVDVFGLPISPMIEENGMIVQYFQHFLLEWHAEDMEEPIQVGDLGRKYFRLLNLDVASALNSLDEGAEEVIYATLAKVRVGVGEEQELSVFVSDALGNALRGVAIRVTITYPNGKVYEEFLPQTNDLGLSVFAFSIAEGNETLGEEELVLIDVFVGDETEPRLVNSFWIE